MSAGANEDKSSEGSAAGEKEEVKGGKEDAAASGDGDAANQSHS